MGKRLLLMLLIAGAIFGVVVLADDMPGSNSAVAISREAPRAIQGPSW